MGARGSCTTAGTVTRRGTPGRRCTGTRTRSWPGGRSRAVTTSTHPAISRSLRRRNTTGIQTSGTT